MQGGGDLGTRSSEARCPREQECAHLQSLPPAWVGKPMPAAAHACRTSHLAPSRVPNLPRQNRPHPPGARLTVGSHFAPEAPGTRRTAPSLAWRSRGNARPEGRRRGKTAAQAGLAITARLPVFTRVLSYCLATRSRPPAAEVGSPGCNG